MTTEVTKARAQATHTRLKKLIGTDVETALAAGRALQAIKEEKLFIELGNKTFGAYVENKLKMPTSWATNRIRLHHYFGEYEPATLPNLKKLHLLANLFALKNHKARIDLWIQRAQDMTCNDLAKLVAKERGGNPAKITWGVGLTAKERKALDAALEEAFRLGANTYGEALALMAKTFIERKRKKAA